jgi:DHA2 family multidrug resistance protein
MTGTLALLPTMLQQLLNYPVFTTGIVVSPRALGSMVAMFAVARVINWIDNRLIVFFGLALTAFAMWQMTGFSLDMDATPLVTSGFIQGFGLGCTFVPLNVTALSTLPRHILTQGTAIRSLMRNLGGSVAISILVAILAENTQTVHARLIETLRPDNPLVNSPIFGMPYSLTAPSGVAALNAEVTRQAAMVAYVDDFWILMVLCLVSIPLLLLLRDASPVRTAPSAPLTATAVADD